jgi:hypothetical protein
MNFNGMRRNSERENERREDGKGGNEREEWKGKGEKKPQEGRRETTDELKAEKKEKKKREPSYRGSSEGEKSADGSEGATKRVRREGGSDKRWMWHFLVQM